ncbi:inner centromere protein-like [Montipora foliosa]|uniref:inner centromere protein-like n=1 Tax=Montipora foliosa TaxID=591990 RepID=UPI0035F16393
MDTYNSSLKAIYNVVAPVQTRRVNHRPWAPWYNNELRTAKQEKRRLERKYRKKIRAEERSSGISPDEPSELDELIQQIIALEESAPTDTCSKDKAEKDDRAKAEDVRMKAMERLSQTKKRELEEDGEDKPKRRRRTTGDAMEYPKERAQKNAEMREKELHLEKERQQQQADMLKVMHQQQMQFQQQQQQFQQFMGIMNRMLEK